MTPIDHAARVTDVTTEVGDATLVVTNLTDLRWLTGFETSNGWAVVRHGELFVGTDGRYGDKARAETEGDGSDRHRGTAGGCPRRSPQRTRR